MLIILPFGLLMLGLACVLAWLSGPAVNPSNFNHIHLGMSEQQVMTILGPGRECRFAQRDWPNRVGTPKQYSGEGYSIMVWYDEAGQVSSKVDYAWGYRWGWDVPLRLKIRRALGWVPYPVTK
jgi:hypothetical protein